MRFDLITLFPGMVGEPFKHSLLGRALERDLFRLKIHDLRDFAEGRHRVCDDYPFGGGEGMVLKVDPIYRALDSIPRMEKSRVILMSPGGIRFDQSHARRLAALDQLIVLCGHYEGVDERVAANLVDEEISIGDFVLTGGELPALLMLEAVARLLPGVVGDRASLENESFEASLLDFPQYTRPRDFMQMSVPQVLLSGNHARIARWRREQALLRTWRKRPDLLDSARLDAAEHKFLERLRGSGAQATPDDVSRTDASGSDEGIREDID